MVRSWTGWNLLSVNCSNRHDFPTPEKETHTRTHTVRVFTAEHYRVTHTHTDVVTLPTRELERRRSAGGYKRATTIIASAVGLINVRGGNTGAVVRSERARRGASPSSPEPTEWLASCSICWSLWLQLNDSSSDRLASTRTQTGCDYSRVVSTFIPPTSGVGLLLVWLIHFQERQAEKCNGSLDYFANLMRESEFILIASWNYMGMLYRANRSKTELTHGQNTHCRHTQSIRFSIFQLLLYLFFTAFLFYFWCFYAFLWVEMRYINKDAWLAFRFGLSLVSFGLDTSQKRSKRTENTLIEVNE